MSNNINKPLSDKIKLESNCNYFRKYRNVAYKQMNSYNNVSTNMTFTAHSPLPLAS